MIDLYLRDIPEKFEKGSELGDLIYQICLAYITSFIFYFLVVYLKRVKDRQILEPYIADKTRTVIHSGKILVKYLVSETGIRPQNFYPTEEELSAMCSKVNPNSFVQGWANLSWMGLFREYFLKSEKAINSIYEKMPFVESKLIRYLGDIQNNPHYYTGEIRPYKMGNTDLSFKSMHLYQYLMIIKDLEKYAEKNLIGYRKLDIKLDK